MTSIDQLMHSLDSLDYELRTQAKHQLISLGNRAIDTLIAAIRLGQGRRAWVAAQVLAAMNDERVVPALIEALDSPNPLVRLAAAEVLGDLQDQRAVPALVHALHDSPVTVQVWAATSLGKLRDASAVEALIEALPGALSPSLRLAMIRALQSLGDPTAIPAIERHLDDADDHVRTRSRKAIRTLRGLPETEN